MNIFKKEELLRQAGLSIKTILDSFDELYETLEELNDNEYMNIMDYIDGTTYFERMLNQTAKSIWHKHEKVLHETKEEQKQADFDFTQFYNKILEKDIY